MASIYITWIPPITDSQSQLVQYKVATSSTWITFSTVSPSDSDETITGILNNVIYDIRIVNNCIYGEVPSTVIKDINIICPTLTIVPFPTTINYSFPAVTSLATYQLQLLDMANNVISVQNKNASSTITGTFTGLTGSTAYKIKVIVITTVKNKSCPFTFVTTGTASYPFKWIVKSDQSYCEETTPFKWIIDYDVSYCETDGDPEPDPEFGNVLISETFIRSCPEGSTGSSVTYTVPENTYFASTQAAANQLAQDNINENGQDNADSEGTCTEDDPQDVTFTVTNLFTTTAAGDPFPTHTLHFTVVASDIITPTTGYLRINLGVSFNSTDGAFFTSVTVYMDANTNTVNATYNYNNTNQGQIPVNAGTVISVNPTTGVNQNYIV